jgi:NAD-dependent dihydropyrimidine dehydrogenase PreA subunit
VVSAKIVAGRNEQLSNSNGRVTTGRGVHDGKLSGAAAPAIDGDQSSAQSIAIHGLEPRREKCRGLTWVNVPQDPRVQAEVGHRRTVQGGTRARRHGKRTSESPIMRIQYLKWMPVVNLALCTGCNRCIDVCTRGTLTLNHGLAVVTQPLQCESVGECVTACRDSAMRMGWVPLTGDRGHGRWASGGRIWSGRVRGGHTVAWS